MTSDYIMSSGNPYQDLGYDNPDAALACADLIIDILIEINRQELDLEGTLTRLDITQERYAELLGGRVANFDGAELSALLERIKSGSQTDSSSEVGIDWLHLGKGTLDQIAGWISRQFQDLELVPLTPAAAFRSRGASIPTRHDTDATDQSGSDPSQSEMEPALSAAVSDQRYRWLPVHLAASKAPESLELVLEHRAPEEAEREDTPKISVSLNGEILDIEEVNRARPHRLDVALIGTLPTDYTLAVSPSNSGTIELHIKTERTH